MPARAGTLRVRGVREFMRACKTAPREAKREVRLVLREVGEIVRRDAKHEFSRVSTTTAAGFRTVVRQRGVSVEQSLRRTTGLRPDWGAKQMRDALIPSLDANESLLYVEMEHAMELVADVFDYKSY